MAKLRTLRGTAMRISNSEIQTWKRCRRKWHFNYYLWLKPNFERETGPSPIGIRVHDVLSRYYTSKMLGFDTDTCTAEALAHHEGVMNESIAKAAANGDDTDILLKECELSRIMLEGYFRSEEHTSELQS